MTIQLSYKYSTLDKVNQFGINIIGCDSAFEIIYIRWVYFFLGSAFANDKSFELQPYEVYKGKILKEYKFCNSSQRQAKLIINKILKTHLNHGR